jgi:hypothetical protein
MSVENFKNGMVMQETVVLFSHSEHLILPVIPYSAITA